MGTIQAKEKKRKTTTRFRWSENLSLGGETKEQNDADIRCLQRNSKVNRPILGTARGKDVNFSPSIYNPDKIQKTLPSSVGGGVGRRYYTM